MTVLAVQMIDLDELRAMLARRERLNRIRDLLPVEEIETGATLTELIDEIDVDALTVQSVLSAKLDAYRATIPEMSVIAS